MKNVQIYLKNLLCLLVLLIFAICFVKAECITSQIDSSNNKYCDINGLWQSQKANDESCQNDFECSIGSCKDGKCQSIDIIKEVESQQSMIQDILDYFFPTSSTSSNSNSGSGGSGTSSICGNNHKEIGEVCDGTDVAGKNCFLLGFSGGILKCSSNCKSWDTTECFVNTPQAPQSICTPVCSSTCGGESSGCGTTCIYNNGIYCGDNEICESGNCIQRLECESDLDCTKDKTCLNNKCIQKSNKSYILLIIFILILLGLLILGIVYLIKKSKKKSIFKPQENNKKSFY